MKVMFVDESGDHSLDVIDRQYPMFVLAGVILERTYAEGELERRVTGFKLKLFGRTDLILRTADITRNQNGFERMKDRAFREVFYSELDTLVASLDFKVVACAIQKEEHLQRYGVLARDPYMLSLDVLVERFCFEIGNVPGGGAIVAERRGPTLDHELELAYLSLKVRGTRYLRAVQIENRITELLLRKKSENVAGLQLADLVATPIGRHVLGKADHEDYKIIESKLRRDWQGGHEGYGLVVLPKPEEE
ncbi:MAG: DUF3800 domain-containing protein [Sedimentisphaerales bacterium]|nr:DUF3800 domain-containing protein [Sedimentisphaerales bacterium]